MREGARFHVRVRISPHQRSPLTAPNLAPQLIAAARRYHESGRWWCDLFLLMPDHVHAIVAFPGLRLSGALRNWKRGVARFQDVAWQENFFDHRLRHEAERERTWRYIRRNPVAQGLCETEDDWPWWWSGGGTR